MNTATGAAEGLLVLSAAGALPALALARARLVVIPLIPLTGAVVASLAVTGMTGLGGTLTEWFVSLSLACAAAVGLWWWRRPDSVPWGHDKSRPPGRLCCLIAGIAGLITAAFGLTSLGAPMTGNDARAIWLLHPTWYLEGHAQTVMILRDRFYTFSHPTYPPLIGGSVGMSWLASATQSQRVGVVMVALLNVLAVLAAASAMVEISRRLASGTEGAACSATLGVGIASAVALIMVTFAVVGVFAANGLADVLWASAAVGAVAYGLLLPTEPANVGAALILSAVAGTTKIEGTVTAAVIVGLVALRIVLRDRSKGELRRGLWAGAAAASVLVVIGVWQVVVWLLHAVADVPNVGARRGGDLTRLHAAAVGGWGQLHVLALAVIVALVGALVLRPARRKAHLGSDGWAWAALIAGCGVVMAAYVLGPGNVHGWIQTSIKRTMFFPALLSWWIIGIWFLIASSTLLSASRPLPLEPSQPSRSIADDLADLQPAEMD